MQLVFNTKANLSQPLSLQFVCNQGGYNSQLVFEVQLTNRQAILEHL